MTPHRATAFEDGTLALAVGAELRIVTRDGSVQQRLLTSGEAICAPPAIAPDGSVWVATAARLYVGRA